MINSVRGGANAEANVILSRNPQSISSERKYQRNKAQFLQGDNITTWYMILRNVILQECHVYIFKTLLNVVWQCYMHDLLA